MKRPTLDEILAMDATRACTLWAEWAFAICYLGKLVENRPWAPPRWLVGQRFAIHAGASIGGRKGRVALSEAIDAVTMTAQQGGWAHTWHTEDGCLIESAAIYRGTDVHTLDAHIQTSAIVCTVVLDRVEENKGQEAPPWAHPLSPFWWHLRDVNVLAQPVPCKGKLGLWKLTG